MKWKRSVLLVKLQEPEMKLCMGGVQGNAESIFTGNGQNICQYLWQLKNN